MWIICAGAPRSGSTLQYQLTSELVEKAGVGFRCGYKEYEEIDQLIKTPIHKYEYRVFKTHMITQSIAEECLHDNVKIIYSFRDIRDVFISTIVKDKLSFNDGINSGFFENYKNSFEAWTMLTNILISKYEYFSDNVVLETFKIAHFLGLQLPDREIKMIGESYTFNKNINRMKSLNDIEEYNGKYHSKKELLHPDHINSGKSEQWREVLAKDQIREIEKRSENWLQKNGYLLYTSPNKFLSYSQFNEDFLVWKILNKKKSGLIIDIGAYDGLYLSKSLGLEQIGWKSICIEPNPQIFPYLENNRKSSTCLPHAIVENEETEQINLYFDSHFLTYNRYPTLNHQRKIIVESKTLNSIFQRLKIKKNQVDIISIDSKGSELEILGGFHLNIYLPKLILIRIYDNKLKQDLFKYFQNISYIFYKEHYEYLIFLRRDCLRDKKSIWFDNGYINTLPIHPKGQEFIKNSISVVNSFKKNLLVNNQLNQFKKNLEKANNLLYFKSVRIEDLMKTHNYKNNDLKRVQLQLKNKDEELKNKDEELKNKDEELKNKDEELKIHLLELKSTKTKLSNIENSRTWKILRKLYHLRSFFKNLFNA